MKRLVRRPAVQGFLAGIFVAYVRLLYATMRWRVEGAAIGDGAKTAPEGAICCLWHSRIALAGAFWTPKTPKRIAALISRSSDGAFIARILEQMGYPAIRGSRARPNSVGEKGGAPAFREMVRWLSAGNAMGVTPDGPKGPAQVMGEGPVLLARAAGARLYLIGLAGRPCVRLNSWDRTVLPLPFSRGAIVWDGPFAFAPEEDPKAAAAELTARLNAATERAEAMLR